MLTGSVHVDPAAGWFPHFLGHAAETCGGTNRNLPLAPGSGDREWLAAVQELARWARGHQPGRRSSSRSASTRPAATRRARSRSPRTATARRAGCSAALGLPTVIVQEGGYALETIGALVRATLAGFEEARHG